MIYLKDVRGRLKKANFLKYKINWDKKVASEPQFRAKKFLKING